MVVGRSACELASLVLSLRPSTLSKCELDLHKLHYLLAWDETVSLIEPLLEGCKPSSGKDVVECSCQQIPQELAESELGYESKGLVPRFAA
jgi:hypothetical protein